MNHLSSGKRRRINRSTSHFSGGNNSYCCELYHPSFFGRHMRKRFASRRQTSLTLNKHPNKDLFLFFFSDFKLIYCKQNEFIHINFQFFSSPAYLVAPLSELFPVLLAWIIDLSFVLFYFHCRCERQASTRKKAFVFVFRRSFILFPRIMTQVFACFTLNAIKVYPSLLSFEGTADGTIEISVVVGIVTDSWRRKLS